MPYPPVAVGKKFALGACSCEPLPDIGVLENAWGGGLSDMARFCREWQIVETLMERQEHDLLRLGAASDSIRTRPNISVTVTEIDCFL